MVGVEEEVREEEGDNEREEVAVIVLEGVADEVVVTELLILGVLVGVRV